MSRLRVVAPLLCALIALTPAARADALPPAKLELAKKATVRLRVTFADGKTASGSGFFASEPGVLLTNAHVVGMPDPSSPPPLKIEVNLEGGKQLSATVLGVDLGADLAALKVEGADLPAPLTLGKSAALAETQELFIFGFPFGKELGKEITVSKSSVSSLRKNPAGVLTQVQVNGGMHPGNSGGPVLNAEGDVVAISVSGIRATQIQFAIPAGIASSFLNGRVSSSSVDLAFKEGDGVKVPFRVTLVDPLKKLKAAEYVFWLGPTTPAQRPASETAPMPAPGDGPVQTFPIALNGTTSIAGELTLPPRPDAQAYWFRVAYTDGEGVKHWRSAFALRPNPVSRTPVTLTYKPKPLSFVDLTSDAELKLREASGENHSLKMNVHPKFREQRLGTDAPVRFRHSYTDLSMSLNMDNEPVNRGDMVRMLQQVRNVTADVEMAEDGGVEKSQANAAKVPQGARADAELIAEQILRSVELMALPLPSGECKPLQSWKSQRVIDIGPSWASVSAAVDVKYTYLGVSEQAGKKLAVFELKGPLKPTRGKGGTNVRGNLDGNARVDTETGEVVSARLTVKADMDMKVDKETWTGHGEIAVSLRRSDTPPAAAPPKK